MTLTRASDQRTLLRSIRGEVVQLSVSDGGVPKLPIDEAHVTVDGIIGDRQRNRRFHGGPDRAVCLWSQEIIHQLQEEGHPVGPGFTGENLTVKALDWTLMQPGSVLEIGSTVVIEVTSFARPCKTNAQWFINGDFRRIDETVHPGWSRVYARVLTEGLIITGTPVVLRATEAIAMRDRGTLILERVPHHLPVSTPL